MDFERIIKEYDGKDALFYLDPPYVGTERHYQKGGGFTMDHHKRLAEMLKSINGRFILSYNDCQEVRELYADFKIDTIEKTYSLNQAKPKLAKELIIAN